MPEITSRLSAALADRYRIERRLRTALFTLDPDLLLPQNEQYALYDIAPDDQRFLMLREVSREAVPSELIVVENFFEELKAREGH